ncbi:DNA-binding MarR family transcriptional regulator [Evansella vedderi]|uniref:DNA-binding MarR family transcriptional regulator n=1 Tax=Evansella vedderi TaxID=38282 RepID=A0ABT9ZWM6_9BACI|nr:MarR family transcriptional regulator [Evansella vedderi]MDQ0254545.1 DNA-binding MarR family transcriptional regulator [Evansella vedderi]
MNLLQRQQLILMTRALYFDIENKWNELGREFNITPAQQHILFLLSTNNNELTPTKIGELGCWHNSTVTRLLNRLQEKKFIYVKTKRNELGFKVVSMTDKGRIILEQLMEKAKTMKKFPFDINHLSEKEVLLFLEYGNKILEEQKGLDFRKSVINAQVEGFDYA